MLKVKIFDEEHEADLEDEINAFLKKLSPKDLVNLHYAVSNFSTPVGEQVFTYSCLILYHETK